MVRNALGRLARRPRQLPFWIPQRARSAELEARPRKPLHPNAAEPCHWCGEE